MDRTGILGYTGWVRHASGRGDPKGGTMTELSMRKTLAGVLTAFGLLALSGCGDALSNYDYATLAGDTHILPPHPASDRADGVKFMVLPIIGAPTNTGDDLYTALRPLMARDKLAIVYNLDEPTTYRIKIDLTAVATNTWTTLIYTVHIHDASGRSVHQFGGQIMCNAGTGDPWSGVTLDYIKEIAARIEGGVYAWTTRDRRA